MNRPEERAAKRARLDLPSDSSSESDLEVIDGLLDAALGEKGKSTDEWSTIATSGSTEGSESAFDKDRKHDEELESKDEAALGKASQDHRKNEHIEDPKSKLILLIDSTTRDRLIATIVQFTTFLKANTTQINTERKDRQLKASQELLAMLMNLPVKDDRSKDSTTEPDLLLLELEHSLRNQILVNLIGNNDALQYGQKFKGQSSQIEGNFKMIQALTELPIHDRNEAAKSAKNEDCDLTGGDANVGGSAGQKSTNPLNSLNNLGKKLISLDKKLDRKLDKKLDKKLDEFKEEIQGLMTEVINTSLNNNAEISYTFKVSDLRSFFNKEMFRYSETFFVRGIPFYLEVLFRDQPTGHLECYLHCDYEPPKSTMFTLRTKVEFRLISPENYGKDLVYKFEHLYEKRIGNGVDRFIDYHDLKKEFVNNDTFYLVCHLFAEKPTFYNKEDNEAVEQKK